jgi:hypothetical protein
MVTRAFSGGHTIWANLITMSDATTHISQAIPCQHPQATVTISYIPFPPPIAFNPGPTHCNAQLCTHTLRRVLDQDARLPFACRPHVRGMLPNIMRVTPLTAPD